MMLLLRRIAYALIFAALLGTAIMTDSYAANADELIKQARAEQDAGRKFALFKQAAEMGSSDAQYQMWHFYRKGNGVAQNEDIALQWLKKAAHNGNMYALLDLAKYYETATLTRRADLFKAVETYKKAEAAGYGYAGVWLKKIEPYVNKIAADQNDLDAIVDLGQVYLVEGRYITALFWFELAARSNHPDGLLKAGSLYEEPTRSKSFTEPEKPTGIPQDLKKTYHYYKRSADLGNEYAQYRMGSAYRYGVKGVGRAAGGARVVWGVWCWR